MLGKQLYAVGSFGLALFLSSCGTDTPPDAVITVVEPDRSTTYTRNTAPTAVVDGTVHFKVEGSSTNTSPLGGANVELSGSSPMVGDTNAGFVAGPVGSGFLNPADPNHLSLTTNSSGVVSVLYQFTVPKCSAADDLQVTASISASIGVSTAVWVDSITVKKDPTC
jgi:hypothetical protein